MKHMVGFQTKPILGSKLEHFSETCNHFPVHPHPVRSEFNGQIPLLCKGTVPETNLIAVALAEATNVADLKRPVSQMDCIGSSTVLFVQKTCWQAKFCLVWGIHPQTIVFWHKIETLTAESESSHITILQKLSALTICQRDFIGATPREFQHGTVAPFHISTQLGTVLWISHERKSWTVLCSVPEMVPEPRRSPGCMLHPVTLWWTNCLKTHRGPKFGAWHQVFLP